GAPAAGEAAGLGGAAGIVRGGHGPSSRPGAGGPERYVDRALGPGPERAAAIVGLSEVAAVRARDGNAADRERRTPRVREGRRLRSEERRVVIAGGCQWCARECGQRRNSGTGPAGTLRAAAGVVCDGRGPGSCPG